MGVPAEILPVVKPSGALLGHVVAGPSSMGLPKGARVAVPVGDHPASVLAAMQKLSSLEMEGGTALAKDDHQPRVCTWLALSLGQ